MKKENKRPLITITIGATLLLLGILLTTFAQWSEKISESGIITIGMIMIIIGTIQMIKKKQGPTKDELTRKIADRAAAYSWITTLIILMIIYWLNFFETIIFTVNSVIAITYTVMVATMLIFQRIYWKKGDVE